MKYISLLRGINVGGNNLIKMSVLKDAFITAGFTNVTTLIASGNVIFESRKKVEAEKLEILLNEKLKTNIVLVLLNPAELKRVVKEVPPDWKKKTTIRRYVAFVKKPMTTQEVLEEIEIKEGVDFVKKGKEVIYMTTKLDGITKSKLSKISQSKVYRFLTIRNFITVEKLAKMV